MTRELLTGKREEGRSFRQLYFSLLMSVFFRSPTYYSWWGCVVAGSSSRKSDEGDRNFYCLCGFRSSGCDGMANATLRYQSSQGRNSYLITTVNNQKFKLYKFLNT
jgi:hypothetical protein